MQNYSHFVREIGINQNFKIIFQMYYNGVVRLDSLIVSVSRLCVYVLLVCAFTNVFIQCVLSHLQIKYIMV